MRAITRELSRLAAGSVVPGLQPRLLIALCAGALVAAAITPAAMAQSKSAKVIFSQEESCRKIYQTGLEFLKNARLDNAAEAFAEVKEACPDMIDAYLNLGAIQVQLGEYLEAIDTYEDAIDQDPGNLDVKEAMAYALSSAGEFEDAVALYLELHKLLPEKADIMKNLAFVYKQSGLIAEAVMLYNRLIELGMADATTVSEAGRMALENKLFFPAVTFYQKLYDFNPEDVNTLSILGGYYWKIRFYERVIPYYEKILEIDPDHSQALLFHRILIVSYKKIKDFDNAARHAEHVLSMEPDDPTSYCNLALIYKDAKDHEKAIETVLRGIEVDSNAGCLYYAWGVALEVQAKLLEKQKRYKEMLDLYNDAKTKFQKVISTGDAHYSAPAKQQMERMDLLIERVEKLIEQEEMGQ